MIYSHLSFKPTDLISDYADAIYQFGCVFFATSFSPDLFLQFLSLCRQLLQRSRPFSEIRIYAKQLVNHRLVSSASSSQPGFYKVGLFADEADIEHGLEYQRQRLRANLPLCFHGRLGLLSDQALELPPRCQRLILWKHPKGVPEYSPEWSAAELRVERPKPRSPCHGAAEAEQVYWRDAVFRHPFPGVALLRGRFPEFRCASLRARLRRASGA